MKKMKTLASILLVALVLFAQLSNAQMIPTGTISQFGNNADQIFVTTNVYTGGLTTNSILKYNINDPSWTNWSSGDSAYVVVNPQPGPLAWQTVTVVTPPLMTNKKYFCLAVTQNPLGIYCLPFMVTLLPTGMVELGIGDNENPYPNPAIDMIKIREDKPNLVLKITDMLGMQVYTGPAGHIVIDKFNAGMYNYCLEFEGKIAKNGKFVKK